MKILALHTDFRLYWVDRLRHLNQRLHNLKHEFVVVEIAGLGSPYAFANQQTINDIDWRIVFPNDKIEDLSPKLIRRSLTKTLDEINPDIIIAGSIAFPSGANAVRWANRHSRKVILFDDSKDTDVPRPQYVDFIKKSIYAGADAIIYPHPDWENTGLKWGFSKKNIFYGVDVINNDFWSHHDANAPLPFPYFMSAGRLIPCKNFDTLIKAFKALHTDHHLVIIGDGPCKDALLKIADNNDKIVFLPFMSPEKLRDFYAHSTAFILPSRQDTWGLVVNEAMAAGAPVLVSRQCGASTLLPNSQTFDYQDTNRLTNLMAQSIDNYASMHKQSIEIIKDWSLDKLAESIIKAINYVSNTHNDINIISKVMISMWNGQYHQP